MPLILENGAVFLHIPKTGGTWFKQAALAAGVKLAEFGDQHGGIDKMVELGKDEEWFDDRFVFTIVRHPLSWYQSRWCFRVKNGWHSKHPLDLNCCSNDFPSFVDNVLKFRPDGWVNWLYDLYNKSSVHPADYVATTENIVDDMVEALHLAGEEFDEDVFRSYENQNSSSMGGFSSSYWAKYTPELLNRVVSVETDVIRNYYPNLEIDLDRYIGDCPYA